MDTVGVLISGKRAFTVLRVASLPTPLAAERRCSHFRRPRDKREEIAERFLTIFSDPPGLNREVQGDDSPVLLTVRLTCDAPQPSGMIWYAVDRGLAQPQNWKMEVIPEAIVTYLEKLPVREVAEGVRVAGFTVHAKMYVPANMYSSDLYWVEILEPGPYIQPEQGSLMEHGEFEFEAVEEVPIGTRLKISVLPAAPTSP
jgi:hypothetical protein